MRLIVCRFVSAASGGRVGRSEKEEKSGSRRGASLCEPRELLKFEPGSGDSDDVGRLGPLLSLRDFKLDHVALLQRAIAVANDGRIRSEEHTSELQSRQYLVCRLLLE